MNREAMQLLVYGVIMSNLGKPYMTIAKEITDAILAKEKDHGT